MIELTPSEPPPAEPRDWRRLADPPARWPLLQPAALGEAFEWREGGAAQADELADWVEGTVEKHRGDAENGYRALEMIHAVYESARCHEKVTLPLQTRVNPLDLMVESGRLAPQRPGRYDIRAFLLRGERTWWDEDALIRSSPTPARATRAPDRRRTSDGADPHGPVRHRARSRRGEAPGAPCESGRGAGRRLRARPGAARGAAGDWRCLDRRAVARRRRRSARGSQRSSRSRPKGATTRASSRPRSSSRPASTSGTTSRPATTGRAGSAWSRGPRREASCSRWATCSATTPGSSGSPTGCNPDSWAMSSRSGRTCRPGSGRSRGA